MSKHRASHAAARRRRVGVLGLALGVTITVGGAAVGVLPQLKAGRASAEVGVSTLERSSLDAVAMPSSAEVASVTAPGTVSRAKVGSTATNLKAVPDLPANSGEGRRIVFDQSDQRVWLVDDDGSIERTYPVSGSRFDNLEPGTYAVQSRSRTATAFDASGTMEYFVRFATGFSEPIGFHSVPRDNAGKLEQTKAQLGTPLSAGCVRQWKPDAIALWDFAPIGTEVRVTA